MTRLLLLAASSALLLSLGLPNEVFKYGFPPLGFVALAPLWVALTEVDGYGRAALLTGLFGALQHALSSYWLYFFKDFAFWTLGSTTIAYGIVYAVFGLYLGFFARRGGWGRPVAFAALWAIFEFLKSNGFLGYPWGLIPYTLTRTLPLLQIADVTGVYGISAVLAFVNATLAEFCLQLPRSFGGEGGSRGVVPGSAPGPKAASGSALGSTGGQAAPAPSGSLLPAYGVFSLLLLAALAFYGYVRMALPVPELGRFTAVITQQDVDPWNTGDLTALEANIRLSASAMDRSPGEKPDIILFSESTLGAPYKAGHAYYSIQPAGSPFIPFIRHTGAYFFAGGPDVLSWEPLRAMNSVMLIDPEGNLVASYGKIHPVPFAEAIPFWEYAPFRNFMQRVVGLDSGWVMGTDYTIFSLPSSGGRFTFGAPICFEDAFASVCRQFMLHGADLLINLTNDSWSTTESAEIQHWAAARFRSIEFRTTLLRSTNGGLSCVVGPYGEIHDALPLFQPAAEIVSVPVYRSPSPTVYERYGDWFPRALLLLSTLWAIILVAEDFGFSFTRRRRP
ncbi:MAG TPA: apolipoprotein N-acyltransferase [Rectinemataceae bacterium]|nr:apolipoprotein N-acyltransferase [Rectinemataceae bacterium]